MQTWHPHNIFQRKCTFLVTQRYKGELRDGQFHGKGFACYEGGHVYKGMFANGSMDGFGVFTWKDGLKYEGEFVCNMPMGQGVFTWPDGSSYKGDVNNGIRHGTGTYTCAKNGISYEGEWDWGKRQGQGVVYFNQSKTSWYKGDWVKNNSEGFGVRCYPSGNIYSGEWKNNLKHGEGTMRWLRVGQEYVGMWQAGVQHGRGTHVWILRRSNGSQYSQSNRYTGEFVQGHRHGQGTFFYAGGAIYEGEWRNNQKHGKGKFTFRDGRVFEGEFVDDRMMTPFLNGNRVPTPLSGALVLTGRDPSALGPDMALSIDCVLDKIPQKRHATERKQVEFVVLRNNTELRSIYGFYSRLGQACSPDNTYLLSRLQLWRLLKDCHVHHHNTTLAQIDHLIKDDATTQIHCPFTLMPLRRFLSCLVIVAYHIYHEDMASQKYLLAACLSKLMTDNILPNAKNIKGFLFRLPDPSLVAVSFMDRCLEVYQIYSKVHSPSQDSEMLTYRHLLWMFKHLNLLDSNLTIVRFMKIITAESQDPSNLSYSLSPQITSLEFFEVLLGCAEIKCQPASESQEQHCASRPEADTRDPSELTQPGKSTDSAVQGISESKQLQSTGHDIKTKGTDAKYQTIHRFFNHFFFPAFDHHYSVATQGNSDTVTAPED